MAEIMPMQIRGKGNAFAVGIGNWAVSTLWNQVSPIALGKIQWKFYFVFVAWSKFPVCLRWNSLLIDLDVCVSFPIIYFFFQETKQKTLEEIDLLFERRSLDQPSDEVERQVKSVKEMGVSSLNVEDIRVRY